MFLEMEEVMIAVASISMRYCGAIKAFTSIILVQGLMPLNTSPCARPYSCHWLMSVTNRRVRTTSAKVAPACSSTVDSRKGHEQLLPEG